MTWNKLLFLAPTRINTAIICMVHLYVDTSPFSRFKHRASIYTCAAAAASLDLHQPWDHFVKGGRLVWRATLPLTLLFSAESWTVDPQS